MKLFKKVVLFLTLFVFISACANKSTSSFSSSSSINNVDEETKEKKQLAISYIKQESLIRKEIIEEQAKYVKNKLGNSFYDFLCRRNDVEGHYHYKYSINGIISILGAYASDVDLSSLEEVDFPYIDIKTMMPSEVIYRESIGDTGEFVFLSNTIIVEVDPSITSSDVQSYVLSVCSEFMDLLDNVSFIVKISNDYYAFARDINPLTQQLLSYLPLTLKKKPAEFLDKKYYENFDSIYITGVDYLDQDWEAGVFQRTINNAYAQEEIFRYAPNVGSLYSMSIGKPGKSSATIRIRKDHFSQYFDTRNSIFDKKEENSDTSKFASILRHEMCHYFGLTDLYSKEGYNENAYHPNSGASIMYGLDINARHLQNRDKNNLLAIYNGDYYSALEEIDRNVRAKYPESKIPF